MYNREGKREGLESMCEVVKEEKEGNLVIAGDLKYD